MGLGPSSRCRNHSRCWAKDRGGASGLGIGVTAGRAWPAVSSSAVSPAGVGASNTDRTDSSTPKTARSREASRIASSEWPPSAKKSSSAPTEGTPSTSAKQSATSSCAGPRGRREPVPGAAGSGSGRAARSSFPFGVSGNSDTTAIAAGTRCAGSRAAR